MAKKIIAPRDMVVMKPIQLEQKSSGGILIPDEGNDEPETGVVIAVGPGCCKFGVWESTIVKVGQIVAIPKLAGLTFQKKIDGQMYYMTREEFILLILEEE